MMTLHPAATPFINTSIVRTFVVLYKTGYFKTEFTEKNISVEILYN